MMNKSIIHCSPPAPSLRVYVVLATILLLLSGIALNFDVVIAAAHRTDLLPGDFRRIIRLSETFAHGFGLAIIVISTFLLAPQLRRRLPRFILCGVLASLSAQLAKLAFVRLRPIAFGNDGPLAAYPESVVATWTQVVEQLRQVDAGDPYFIQAFPSAHAAMAAGMAVGLCWLLPRGRWLFIVLACLSCYQRIQSHAHWSSDVFAGAAVGVLVAGLLLQDWGLGWVLSRYENRVNRESETIAENMNS